MGTGLQYFLAPCSVRRIRNSFNWRQTTSNLRSRCEVRGLHSPGRSCPLSSSYLRNFRTGFIFAWKMLQLSWHIYWSCCLFVLISLVNWQILVVVKSIWATVRVMPGTRRCQTVSVWLLPIQSTAIPLEGPDSSRLLVATWICLLATVTTVTVVITLRWQLVCTHSICCDKWLGCR